MNVRKPTDYSAMYGILDQLMGAEFPQMELYFEIGRSSVPTRRRARRSWPPSISRQTTLGIEDSPRETCGGCGNFTAPMPTIQS